MVDKMEASEEVAAVEDSGEKTQQVVLETSPVDSGSNSTEEEEERGAGVNASTSMKEREKDGSVVSAMTDRTSLEGNAALPRLITGQEEASSQMSSDLLGSNDGASDAGVPKQVILPDNDGADEADYNNEGSGGPTQMTTANCSPLTTAPDPESAAEPELLIVTETPQEAQSAGQDEAVSLPDRRAADESPSAGTSIAATTPGRVEGVEEGGDEDGSMDDYIKSPEVQNAIVERSPGGRYVRFMEKLGSGASKDVYRAYDTQEGIEVAWNVVNLAGVPKPERNRIVNEVRLLERLHHHNIISFHGSWVNRERQEVNFVTEILSSGTLKSFINKVQVIRWKIAKRWALQILKGLEYLHSQDPPVIHRDLKCENIFINGTSGDLRIGDLGLSTVHRNGRVLSVLGTPEFMAPDMYEQNSYDEKVDVYAFGMCMLEIFTKEIPYSECNNPAQIYKKVSAGQPPEVLSRLQSKHAREFIMLCLGYRDDDGNFIRPTVAELLQHPFLDKRSNDDDEVVVEPPIRERTIAEGHESGTPSKNSRREMSQPKPRPQRESSSQLQPQKAMSQTTQTRESSKDDSPSTGEARLPPARGRLQSFASSNGEEDSGDRFEEMQESEITMRKVKVLMGRDHELKEEEEANVHSDDPQGETRSSASGDGTVDSAMQAALQPPSVAQPLEEQDANQYLVAAVVIEDENPNVRPYDDDVLKLVIILPVDGQTQNVQFDFHLVEDDPIQVAKEMVRELGIPQGAVLEISETISGLARTARMRQDRHALWMQQNNAQNQMQPQYQQPQGGQPGQQHVQPPPPPQGQHSQQPQGQHAQHAQGVPEGQQEPAQYQQQPPPSQHVQQEQTQYQQQLPPPQHVQQEQAQYQQQPRHSRERNESQNDMSQYQQALQPTMHQMPQHSQSQPDFSQFQQQGGNPVQHSQYQQIAPAAPQVHHVQHQGATSGGHPQEQVAYQQAQQAPPQPLRMQQQGSVMSAGGGGGAQEQPQYQQQHHQGQVMSSGSPQESYAQHPALQSAASQEMQQKALPPLHTQHQGARMSAVSQEQTQYHQQGQGHHVEHGVMPSSGLQESPRQYQLQSGPQGAPQDVQQQQQQQQQILPSSSSSQSLPPLPSQQRQIRRQSGGEQEQQMQMPGQPGVYSQSHQPQFHAQVPGMDPGQQPQVQFNQMVPTSVSPPPPPQVHVQTTGQSMPASSTLSAGSAASRVSHLSIPPQFQNPASGSAPPPQGQVGVSHPSAPPVHPGLAMSHHGIQGQEVQVDEAQKPPAALGHGLPHHTAGDSVVAPPAKGRAQGQSVPRDESIRSEGSASQSPKIPGPTRMDSTVTSTSSVADADDSNSDVDSDDEGGMSDELRKLDEDFKKNLQRAKKVFYNRMDNLQRSQVEREAQHQKTLEKHEKERLDFEKRLAQEEEQQNRRIEQLQREWDKRRETVAKHKRKGKNGHHQSTIDTDLFASQDSLASFPTSTGSTLASLPTTAASTPPVTTVGHVRNVSAVSSTFSESPAVSDKKLPVEPPKEGQGGNAES